MSEHTPWLHALLSELGYTLVSILDSRRDKLFAQVRTDDAELAFFKCGTSSENTSVAREAKILSEMSGELVIRPRASGVTRDIGWMILPWYSLRSAGKMFGAPAELTEAFLAAAGIFADLVGELHSRGFLHGDLQPAHFVWLEELKAWRVIDFDCARKIGELADKPEGGLVHFLPPEFAADQLEGEVREHFSGASDVYSLAATLSYLLTGKAPRKTLEAKQAGADYRRLLEIVRDAPSALPGELGVHVPQPLQEILIQCLDSSPENRPTAFELREVLRHP